MTKNIESLFDGSNGVYFDEETDALILLENKYYKQAISLVTGKEVSYPLFNISNAHKEFKDACLVNDNGFSHIVKIGEF